MHRHADAGDFRETTHSRMARGLDNGTMYTGVRTACKTARSARALAHHARPRTTRTPRLRLSRYAASHDRA